MVLLAKTVAPAPMAVALVKAPDSTSARSPIAVFCTPVVFTEREL